MIFHELPSLQRRAIDLVKEVAVEKECRPFLVGGPVRDLLLGRHSIDIDLTVEGGEGSSVLARTLAKRIDGGRVRSFPQFLTYKVTAEDFPEIDITTARKERYRKPGALPTVTPGKLKDDLVRRDFSINAIAIDILSGEQHDPTGGKADLDARVVRVLHDQSFIDDPTRIYRALRLAARLGFALDPHTRELLDAAIREGALGLVSKERLWRELFLAMEERNAPDVLASLTMAGALAPIVGDIDVAGLRERLEVAQQQLAARPELDRDVLFTGALLQGTDATAARLEGSGFSQKRTRNALRIANDLPRLESAVAEAHNDRQRFRLFRTLSPEILGLIAARRPDESRHVERFHEFRNFKLPLRGNDLEVPLGPHVAKALERTREAVFNGEIEPEQARSFAREMAMKYLEREP
jgi:tRNA nucleotidyltransferase/poly(A) polymerase